MTVSPRPQTLVYETQTLGLHMQAPGSLFRQLIKPAHLMLS
jgi:hypothetical protein